MLKKKLLFIIPSLDLGGAEKALVNLLNIIDLDRFDVDVLVFKQNGFFQKLLPSSVQILLLDSGAFLLPFKTSLWSFFKAGNFKAIVKRIQFARNIKMKNVAIAEQQNWHLQKEFLPLLDQNYDTAIAFLEKTSIYYLVDKVQANKKIGWIHTDYNKSGLNANFDRSYFNRLDRVVTISETCKESLVHNFPELKERIAIVPNFSSAKLIKGMSQISVELEKKQYNFVTLARLSKEKGIDIAINAAVILKKQKLHFRWDVLGEGTEKSVLQKVIIESNLEDCVHLLGAKINPYPYVKCASFYIQPSRYEGKSIAIDEALILGIPVIINNYPSAADQIQEGVNGFIAGNTSKELAAKILKTLNDPDIVKKVKDHLSLENYSNEEEISIFYDLLQ